jgi:hypothetical protein
MFVVTSVLTSLADRPTLTTHPCANARLPFGTGWVYPGGTSPPGSVVVLLEMPLVSERYVGPAFNPPTQSEAGRL